MDGLVKIVADYFCVNRLINQQVVSALMTCCDSCGGTVHQVKLNYEHRKQTPVTETAVNISPKPVTAPPPPRQMLP